MCLIHGLPEGSMIGHTVTSRKMGVSQKGTWKGAIKSLDRNSKGRPGRFQELGRCKKTLEGAPLKFRKGGRLQKRGCRGGGECFWNNGARPQNKKSGIKCLEE